MALRLGEEGAKQGELTVLVRALDRWKSYSCCPPTPVQVPQEAGSQCQGSAWRKRPPAGRAPGICRPAPLPPTVSSPATPTPGCALSGHEVLPGSSHSSGGGLGGGKGLPGVQGWDLWPHAGDGVHTPGHSSAEERRGACSGLAGGHWSLVVFWLE